MAGITLPPESGPTSGRSSARADAAVAPRSPATDSNAAGSGTEPSSSTVELSGLARQAANLEARIERNPGFDAARVAALRQAISDGSYEVDSSRLASAIIRLEQGL